MNDSHDPANEPRWLQLAATLRATPDAATLAHVRARLAARAAGPAWVRWLSRPVALVASAAVLVLSVFAGSALLSASNTAATDTSVVSTLLVVNAVVSFMPERRAAGVVETLRRRLQVRARVLREAS